MPPSRLNYSKWDSIGDDSDDEQPSFVPPEKDPAMEAFFQLGKDASVKQIQDTIANMPNLTKEELLRHEKGGLLKRMMELDPNREYEEGEIWGTGKSLPKPTMPQQSAPPASEASPPKQLSMPPARKASIDYSKFDLAVESDCDSAVSGPEDSTSTSKVPSVLQPGACNNDQASSKAAALTARSELASSMSGHRPFTFVRLPADCHIPIEEETGFEIGTGDVLPTLLSPLFKSSKALDPETVARESAARVKEMKNIAAAQARSDSNSQADDSTADSTQGVSMPSESELDRQAKMGVCEAWPLLTASEQSGWLAVKLYIDEVGALRRRDRNARAEALCAAVGQRDLTIHGDAYVGRIEHYGRFHCDERNVDFAMHELCAPAPL